jgi:hypothetical protein
MSALPQWLLGRHVTGVYIRPMQSDGSGILQYQEAAASLRGQLDQIERTHEVTHENIKPFDSKWRNNVIMEEGSSYTLTEVMKRRPVAGATHTNILPELAASYDHFEISFTRGKKKYTAILVRGREHETLVAGKNAFSLDVLCIAVDNGDGTFLPGEITEAATDTGTGY